MNKVAYIFLPYFHAQVVRQKYPRLARQPLVIYREGKVVGVSPEPGDYAIEGLPVTEAKGKCPDAFFLAYDDSLYKEACVRYLEALTWISPVIEPEGEGSCFFDLTGSDVNEEMAKLKKSLQAEIDWGQVLVGMGRNKLVAKLAALLLRQSVPAKAVGFYCREIAWGEEKEFMKNVPIAMDWLLTFGVINALNQLGFKSYGELQGLRVEKLVDMLGGHGYTVYRHSRGIDDTPLVNSYPPGRLALAFSLDGATESREIISRVLKKSAQLMASLLYSRRKGCRFVKLALAVEGRIHETGRLVPWGCREEERLHEVLTLILDKMVLSGSVTGVRVEASSLYDWEFAEQDLFDIRTRPRYDLAALTLALNEKYPGAIWRGIEARRREEVLSLWDPWRFAGETR